MDSLAHWDFAVQFSGYEAAALILGIDPGKPESPTSDQSPIKAVFERLALHYDHALQRQFVEAYKAQVVDEQDIETNRPFELISVSMHSLRNQWDANQEDTEFTDWLVGRQSAFAEQTFSRDVIADWLDANELVSVYRFKLDEHRPDAEVSGRWPWGNHHTEMLGHLEAAARKFWVNYDPTDSTTAPTNEMVSTWLSKERGLSKIKADSIASILRVDGLPTGPRK